MKYLMAAWVLGFVSVAQGMPIGLDGEPIWASCPNGVNEQCEQGFVVYRDWESYLGGNILVDQYIGVWWRESPRKKPEYLRFPVSSGVYRLPHISWRHDVEGARVMRFQLRCFGEVIFEQQFVVSVVRDSSFSTWLVVSPFTSVRAGG